MSKLQVHPVENFGIDSLLGTLRFIKPVTKDNKKIIQSDAPLTIEQQNARVDAWLEFAMSSISYLNEAIKKVVKIDNEFFLEESDSLKDLRESFKDLQALEDKMYNSLNLVRHEVPFAHLEVSSSFSSLLAELEGLVFQSNSNDLDWDNLLSNDEGVVKEWKPELV